VSRRDPGAATGTAVPTTEPDPCGCGHREAVHAIGTRGRGACSASFCGCRRYAPGAGTTPAPAGGA
jgi:hypothetical protein